MKLAKKQIGVFKGMAMTMLVALLTVTLGVMADPLNCHQLEGLEEKFAILG